MRTPGHIIYVLMAVSFVWGQGTWQWSGRVHPELDWYTLETEHFNIHYHNGIEEIARQGASIAEQTRSTLLTQMGLDTMPKVDITFTSEDEIMNGYALWTNMVFIWVDQNDVAIWLEDEKWLYQVVTHELQHIVLFNAVKTWIPEPWSFLFSGMPGWFVEGSAEYFTERWRPYRADLSHKLHVLQNNMDQMDPHHDGYSKLLYLSDRFGDSTLVKLVQHRNKLKTYNFKKGFKKHTGISLKQFEEDWRRHMNTYYYGYRAQKETVEEIGEPGTLPVKKMSNFSFAADSMMIAIVGRNDLDQVDQSLYIAQRDTAKERKELEKDGLVEGLKKWFKFLQDTVDVDEKRPQIIWDLEEKDFGYFGPGLTWSPDGQKIVYSKYHYGVHQSMIWDIRLLNIESGKMEWLTQSFRASHPHWSPEEDKIVFVAHTNNTSNLFTINPDGSGQVQLTDFPYDTQVLNPRWSPDGSQIAFAKASPEGNTDIYTLDFSSREITRLTEAPEVDNRPVWHPDGAKITYTSHQGSTPNLHTVDLSSGKSVQNTDVGDAVWSHEWTPKDSTITALTLGDVDTVRIVKINPERISTTDSLSLRDTFTRWRTKTPDHPLLGADPHAPVDVIADGSYQFRKHVKHFMSLAFPYLDGSGAFGLTSFADAMGRHLIQVAAGAEWSEDSNPWFLLSYLNAQHGPLWGVNYFYNSRWNFRYYDRSASGLYERLDGLQLWTQIPLNFGRSMASNHDIQFALTFQERIVVEPYDSLDADGNPIHHLFSDDGLPEPESGQEGIASFTYRWLDRRPHRKNVVLPNQGKGLLIRTSHVNKSLYGDFTYTRLSTDGFINFPGGGPNGIFLRLKSLSMFGTPPAQEYVGLSRDPSIYVPGGIIDEGIFGLQENHNPRGWDEIRLGDRLIFGTLEYRFPLISVLPLNVLGFTLGSVTGAILSDFGNAWYAGKEMEDWVVTLGYEAKVALQVEKSPLLIFSIGFAQTVEEWQSGKEPDPNKPYLRLALINPF